MQEIKRFLAHDHCHSIAGLRAKSDALAWGAACAWLLGNSQRKVACCKTWSGPWSGHNKRNTHKINRLLENHLTFTCQIVFGFVIYRFKPTQTIEIAPTTILRRLHLPSHLQNYKAGIVFYNMYNMPPNDTRAALKFRCSFCHFVHTSKTTLSFFA